MILTPYPRYFDDEPVERQVEEIRNYLTKFKDELQSLLSAIKYEDLDPAVKERFDSLTQGLTKTNKSLEELRTFVNTNVLTADGVKTGGITVGSHTYGERTATIDGTEIHYLGY